MTSVVGEKVKLRGRVHTAGATIPSTRAYHGAHLSLFPTEMMPTVTLVGTQMHVCYCLLDVSWEGPW